MEYICIQDKSITNEVKYNCETQDKPFDIILVIVLSIIMCITVYVIVRR